MKKRNGFRICLSCIAENERTTLQKFLHLHCEAKFSNPCKRRPHDHEVSDLDLEAPSNNSFGFTGNEDTMFERATFALGKHRSDSNEIKY